MMNTVAFRTALKAVGKNSENMSLRIYHFSDELPMKGRATKKQKPPFSFTWAATRKWGLDLGFVFYFKWSNQEKSLTDVPSCLGLS